MFSNILTDIYFFHCNGFLLSIFDLDLIHNFEMKEVSEGKFDTHPIRRSDQLNDQSSLKFPPLFDW